MFLCRLRRRPRSRRGFTRSRRVVDIPSRASELIIPTKHPSAPGNGRRRNPEPTGESAPQRSRSRRPLVLNCPSATPLDRRGRSLRKVSVRRVLLSIPCTLRVSGARRQTGCVLWIRIPRSRSPPRPRGVVFPATRCMPCVVPGPGSMPPSTSTTIVSWPGSISNSGNIVGQGHTSPCCLTLACRICRSSVRFFVLLFFSFLLMPSLYWQAVPPLFGNSWSGYALCRTRPGLPLVANRHSAVNRRRW